MVSDGTPIHAKVLHKLVTSSYMKLKWSLIANKVSKRVVINLIILFTVPLDRFKGRGKTVLLENAVIQ
jgi:hypothetical protein